MRVFVGFDPREAVSFHVASHSILRRSSIPVEITPLALCNLSGDFHRDREALQSTDFSFTRFLVPHLCGFRGFALYLDSDVLVRTDIKEMEEEYEYYQTVKVVKHDYIPKDTTKFLGEKQTSYARKNWSSVMLFNCERSKKLTPEYVEKESGLNLHQFAWTDRIGDLPKDWNHLVGEEPENPKAKIVHFTRGGPWFHEYSKGEFSREWFEEFESMSKPYVP